jgi:dolichol-phosphate mannosyltransferase
VTPLGARRWYTKTTNGFRGHSGCLPADPHVDVFREAFDAYKFLAYLPVRAARLGYWTCEVPVVRAYPSGDVSTKISSVRGRLCLPAVVLRAATSRYDLP